MQLVIFIILLFVKVIKPPFAAEKFLKDEFLIIIKFAYKNAKFPSVVVLEFSKMLSIISIVESYFT